MKTALATLPWRDTAAWGTPLVRSLKRRWQQYCRRLQHCQEHLSETSVHNLRVETRRMLSVLDLLSSFCPGEDVRTARRRLKKRLDAFDDLRDTQVQLRCLKRMQRAYPALKTYRKKLKRRERKLTKTTADKIKSARTARLDKCIRRCRRSLEAIVADPARRKRRIATLSQAVDRAFNQVVTLRRRIDPAQTKTIHRTRVAFKKFRYMVEALQPVLPEASPARLKTMRNYQTTMGEIQDLEVLLARTGKREAKKNIKGPPLRLFREELTRQRAVLVAAYLASADQLYTFWPSPKEPR